MPLRMVFILEMRLPIDALNPLPDQPRDVRTITNQFCDDLDWADRVARKVTDLDFIVAPLADTTKKWLKSCTIQELLFV